MVADVSLGSALLDIATTYAHALASVIWLAMPWAIAFIALASAPVRKWWSFVRRPLRAAIYAALVVAAVAWAWHLMSLFDDAYISLRYARNLVRGHGLVFNIDDRVEGYTNFLWTMILAGGLAAGLDGAHFAIVGCLVLFALELLLVARVSRLLAPEASGPVVPFASILLGASYTFATYGTTGMETMLSACLATLAVERALVGSIGLSGLAGILSVMNHPDFALPYVGLGVALVLDRDRRRLVWRYVIPLLAIYVPYFFWRWQYYGDLLPNTYYAKSGNLTYWRQGFIYLAASGLACGLWALAPLALHAVWRRPKHLVTRFFLFGLAPYVVYVARVGGDFMICRLLVGVLPVFALLAERGFRDILAEGRAAPRWIAFALMALAVVPAHLVGWRTVKWYLSDERTFFAVSQFWPTVIHENMQRALAYRDLVERGAHPVVGEFMVGLSGYDSDLPMIDELGLTDRTVAHQPLARRGRPGHEKLATPAYLKSRDVRLSYEPMFPEPYAGMTLAQVRRVRFYLGRYDPELVSVLRSIPGAMVPDLPARIDDYVARAAIHPPDSLSRDLAFFEEFYFAATRDPQRRARMERLLTGSAGP